MSLRDLSAASILAAIGDAAHRWCDADFPPRVRASDAIVQRTGYSAPMVEYALDVLFGGLNAGTLRATIESELGSVAALDGFVSRAGRPSACACPLGRVCVIASRTTIGVALLPALFALCAKNGVLVKDREDRLVALFFETLAQERDEFRSAARAQSWRGENGDATHLGEFDAVVAFGADETLAQIRAACAPGSRFIGFGSAASAGYVSRDALTQESRAGDIAEAAARDLVLYESEGCMSLHVLFAERGAAVEPARFAALLSEAVDRAAVEFPLGRRDVHTHAQVAGARDAARFRAAAGSGAVFSDPACHYVILFDPQPQPPAFLPRTLGVIPVNGTADAAAYLRRHPTRIEAFAIEPSCDNALQLAIATGAARVTQFGNMQRPAAGGNHGGRARIVDFIRWIDREW